MRQQLHPGTPVTVKTCSKSELAGDSTNIPGGDNGTQTGGWTSGPSLKPEVIATAGDFFLGTNASLSWTLGEPVIESFGEHLQLFTQGFQQAGYMVVATQEIQGDPGYRIELYPVPSTDYVNIVIHATKSPVGLRLELFDLTGKMVWKRSVETETFSEKVDLTQYPASLFMLKVTNTIDPHIRSFKIVKYR